MTYFHDNLTTFQGQRSQQVPFYGQFSTELIITTGRGLVLCMCSSFLPYKISEKM